MLVAFRATWLACAATGRLFLLLGTFAAVSGETFPIATNAWRQRKPLPEGAVFAATVGAKNGIVYVMSGFTGPDTEKLSDANRVYDPRLDQWRLAAPVPTPRSESGAGIGSDGIIYLVGGNPSRGRKESARMNKVEAYNPRLDRWTIEPPLPTPRTALCVVAARDAGEHLRIYAIGGRNFDVPGNGLNTVEAFDPDAKTWRSQAPMPMGLHAMTAAVGPDGNIYVAGGTNAKVDDIDTVQVYDPKKDRWMSDLRMPYGQECASAISTSDELIIIGGWSDPRKIAVSTVVAFDPKRSSWRALPSLPFATAAAGASAFRIGDSGFCIYVFGGMPDATRLQELQILN